MANIELDGANKKIKVDSGDLTLDVPGDIILDADGADLVFADGGTNILKVTNSSSDVVFQPQVDAKDIIFKQYDGTEVAKIDDDGSFKVANSTLGISQSSSDVIIKPLTDAKDIIFQQYDGTAVATVEDNGTLNIPTSKLAINGTAITSTAAELNILDGVTSTATEINLLDGGTSVGGSITIADADGFIINDGGTMKTIPATDLSTYIGGGITEADQWRVSANESTWTSSGRHYITSNWERVDNAQFQHIGTGMSESSGVFTFPSTGKYYIRFQLDWTNREGGTNRALTYMMAEIGVTANNSSYSQFAHGNSSNDDAGGEYYHSVATSYILDVSDTSNIKVKMGAYIANPMKYLGNTGYNKTHVTFIRLGDT